MIEVYVRDQQPVDIGCRESDIGKRSHQMGNRMVGAAIDEGSAAVLDDQVGGIEVIAMERGVDGVDAVPDHAISFPVRGTMHATAPPRPAR